jgi:hypothetical protein
MVRVPLLVILAFTSSLSACLQHDAESPSQCAGHELAAGDSCTATTPTTDGSTISVRGCTRLFHTIYVRNEAWNPEFPLWARPRTFSVYASTPFHVANIASWNCDTLQIGPATTMEKDFRLFLFSAQIEPPTKAAVNDTFSSVLFQGYTNSPAFGQKVLRAFKFPLAIVDLQRPAPSNLSTSPFANAAYELTVAPNATSDYSITGLLDPAKQVKSRAAEVYYPMNAKGPQGFHIQWQGATTRSAEAIATFGGGSYWARHSSVREVPLLNLYGLDIQATIGFDDEAGAVAP